MISVKEQICRAQRNAAATEQNPAPKNPRRWRHGIVSCCAGAVAGAFVFTSPGAAAQPAIQPRVQGEPYELSGHRLVFTSWYYVRPGAFAWLDEQGRNVSVAGSQGPWGAAFSRRDYPHGIRLVAQPARSSGPLLKPERPWEEQGISFDTVLSDAGRFRAWGRCSSAQGRSFFGYFESKDGWQWERPELGLVEYEGSRKNNLLPFNPGTVFKDPSAPEAERYKAVDLGEISTADFAAYKKRRPEGWEPKAHRTDVGHIYAVWGCVSPDGLHWRRLPEPLVVEHSDTQLVAYYDEGLRKYVLYTRNYMIGSRSPNARGEPALPWWGGDAYGIGRRSIGRTESDDFRQFPLSKVMVEPGPDRLPNDLLYTNCRTSIPGAADHHLLFPAIWHTSDDTTSIDLAASYDGRLWHFLPGSPVFQTAAFGQWDGGSIFTRPNLIELPNGDFALPYTGYNFPHKYPRGQWRFATGYALWPKGRLVALEAPVRGEFATVALLPPGPTLWINALTQRAGSIQVEVANQTGKPLAGRTFAEAVPILGDQPWVQVRWKEAGDLGTAKGEGVILRFRLEKAAIFGLEFRASTNP